jgi:hypothetical protein
LLVGSLGFIYWRHRSLEGYPDVGDPFNVQEALEPTIVPDSENAYVLYAAAYSQYTRPPASAAAGAFSVTHWTAASPDGRNHLATNRKALDVWRAGTERPKALYHQIRGRSLETLLPLVDSLNQFSHLGLLEGSRVESLGDMDAAWGWYRAVLRSSRHAAHGFLVQRLIGAATHKRASDHIFRWAADPRVEPQLLRRALDDVIASDEMTPPMSQSLKWEYLILMRDMDEMRVLVTELPTPFASRDWYRQHAALNQGVDSLQRAHVTLSNDRERSRRVLRMLYANWLAQVDKPSRLRAKIAVQKPRLIYEADPTAPYAARALPPQALARALDRTMLAKAAFSMDLPAQAGPVWELDGPVARERLRQADLVVFLATQLHQREHGQPPATVQDLVGPYLRAIPEDYKEPANASKQ